MGVVDGADGNFAQVVEDKLIASLYLGAVERSISNVNISKFDNMISVSSSRFICKIKNLGTTDSVIGIEKKRTGLQVVYT
jgi:branched-subunit amino acid aminotransferase/4-amino-4-deoxychorismate lyase